MKILVFSNLLGTDKIGGAEVVAWKIIEQLALADNKVTVVTMNPSKNGTLENYSKNIKIVYYVPKMNYFPFDRKLDRTKINPLKKLLWHSQEIFRKEVENFTNKTILEEKPDILQTFNISGYSSAIWVAAKKNHLPIVHTLQDYYLLCPRNNLLKTNSKLCYNYNRKNLFCEYYSKKMREKMALVDMFIGVGKRVVELHLIPPEKSTIILNHSTEIYKKKEFYSSKKQGLNMFFIGRLEKAKGLDFLLETFEILLKKNNKNTLTIAGSGPLLDMVNNYSELYKNNIFYVGFADKNKKQEIFEKTDVIIVPSIWDEPAPLVTFEGLSAGIPIICSDMGEMKNTIENQINGLVFNSQNTIDLLEKIDFMTKNLAFFTKNAMNTSPVTGYHTAALEYLEIYKKIIAKR